MVYSAIDISFFFIRKGVTPLKLQKLLFYSQVWYFAKYKNLLFKDEIQAWVLGPVVRNVWDKYKFIKRGSLINERFIEKDISDKAVISHLNEIWDVYGGYTGLELVDLTHDETLWIKARGEISPEQKSTNIIKINEQSISNFSLDNNGRIPHTKYNVNGLASFSGNVGEELF
ncbi:Panacea domain-containing protein [Riemerella columbina]|uniref:Panacea domain-containing protein n=1 Tax=Riemerella columbina TaxID=103810 RepID=UPI000377712E|nr:type II toxin-antitoxin system antitoxin SocA domain-containing protein [Riemerella columbina]